MAKLNTYSCTVCSTVKKETNHWWLGITTRVDQEGPSKHVFERVIGYSLTLWDATTAVVDGVDHLCGIECALKWMGTKLDQLTK